MGSRLGKLVGVDWRQAAVTEPKARDQGAVNEYVRVAPERQAKMTEVPRRIDGLCLAAQDQLMNERRMGRVGGPPEHRVEMMWPEHLTLGQRKTGDAEASQELAERVELRGIGWLVDAVHAGLAQTLQGFGRRDIGQDHQLLDELVAVEPRPRLDARDVPVRAQDHAALGQVE